MCQEFCTAVVEAAHREPALHKPLCAASLACVLAAMDAHPRATGVQEYACWVLQNLAVNSANRVAIAAQGGISRLLSVMDSHRGVVDVWQPAIGALSCLAFENVDNAVDIARRGGVARVLGAMDAHVDEGELQMWACGALWGLSYSRVGMADSLAGGGVAKIRRALVGHPFNEKLQEWGRNALANLIAV